VDHGTTQQSANDNGPTLVVATQPGQTGLGELVTSAQRGRLFMAVFAGTKRTGGFAVEVDRFGAHWRSLRDPCALHRVAAERPGYPDAHVSAQLVSAGGLSASGVREVVLLDQAGVEVARSAVPQSQP
jgi:predicted phage gp36 major capsid-like protein